MALSACSASATVVYGPTVTVCFVAALAVTTNDVPRAIALSRTSSRGSAVDRSRNRCQPAVTWLMTRANAAGSTASAYDCASRPRSVRPSARVTSLSRIGPARSTAAPTTPALYAEIVFAAPRATTP